MHPVFLQFGGVTIYWYGVMVALGFLASVVHWNLLGRREGRPPGFGAELAFWIMLGGILGGRLAYVFSNLHYFTAHPGEIARIDHGGLIFYGGLFGGLAASWLIAKARHESFLKLGDFIITALPLGHALGRVGCFLNGCCYGIPCRLPWAVRFPPDSHPDEVWPGQSLHPVQLYESGWNLALYGALLFVYLRGVRPGRVASLYFVFYGTGRFLFEFLRGDPRLRWQLLTVAQWTSLAVLAGGLILWWISSRKPKADAPS
ncbi:prolipoprotein diacylglyceryl transferase [Kiritimatiella glycovorans]|uniref:Phosphatidylglycerol--prolipoprotein diacylglyceryl transferase n=1 Tax=Kiritimatiella glycovorans TaxID=1307763 RepID=A0A0G3EDG7_9BACT|nr:prolipoprotein diacylglyceryl transferase [Kiritimatiella glycovorans]AKJ64521.1 Prolipoprotein diacylglyceryl transferase [Kiritimatiella glycovorans]